MLILANALRLWFGLGLAICLIGMLLGIWQAFAVGSVFGLIILVLTVSTRKRPMQSASTTKNVCRECGHMIALENGAWVLDSARERELSIRMRG